MLSILHFLCILFVENNIPYFFDGTGEAPRHLTLIVISRKSWVGWVARKANTRNTYFLLRRSSLSDTIPRYQIVLNDLLAGVLGIF